VWRFFRELDERYADLHPEHSRRHTLREEALSEGAVVFADELIGPRRLSARFFICNVEAGRSFSYRIGFPASLVRAGGSFHLSPIGRRERELVEEVQLGFRVPLVGSLVDRVLPLAEVRRHIREEGENLARPLGADTEGA
jgi:hypothetical protein